MPPSKWVVICSPVSGKKKGKEVVEQTLMPRIKEVMPDVPVDVRYTEYFQHSTAIAKEVGSADVGIIAVGGDGTIHEILTGLGEKGVLAETPLGLLSQGTMNFYAVTGGLPDANGLPDLISQNSFRSSTLMHVSDEKGFSTRGFEACHIGVGYKPAKGAQEWRHSFGPMFGIMYNVIKSLSYPETCTVKGTLEMYPADGGDMVSVTDDFFQIVISPRNIYNGALTDDLYVSWLTLKNYPGFGRMMDSFSPPLEIFAGTANVSEGHTKVEKVIFRQKVGGVGLCLDGDAVDLGNEVTITAEPHAFKVVAPLEYPRFVPEQYYKLHETTACAKEWLAKNPPPKDLIVPTPPPPPEPKKGWCSCTQQPEIQPEYTVNR